MQYYQNPCYHEYVRTYRHHLHQFAGSVKVFSELVRLFYPEVTKRLLQKFIFVLKVYVVQSVLYVGLFLNPANEVSQAQSDLTAKKVKKVLQVKAVSTASQVFQVPRVH